MAVLLGKNYTRHLFQVSSKLPRSLNHSAERAEIFLMTKLHILNERKLPFTYTSDAPTQVIHTLDQFITRRFHQNAPIRVEPWLPKLPWSKAVATVFDDQPDTIYINTRFVHPQHRYVGTMIHELCHMSGYTHGTDRWRNFNQHKEPKLSSVPIWLAAKAVEWELANAGK